VGRARKTPRKAKPHGEQAIYAGSESLGLVIWRTGYSQARSPVGRLIGKFLHAMMRWPRSAAPRVIAICMVVRREPGNEFAKVRAPRSSLGMPGGAS
jgi:hypothetical protein